MTWCQNQCQIGSREQTYQKAIVAEAPVIVCKYSLDINGCQRSACKVTSLMSCPSCGSAIGPNENVCQTCGTSLYRLRSVANQSPPTPSSSVAGQLPIGSMLRGRYRLISLAGTGGMGAVYKAEDLQVGGRLVAVKEMSQSGLNPQELAEATEAFEREAFLLAQLQEAHLPRVYDYFTQAGRWYVVMDFIAGETLEQRLQRVGQPTLPPAEVLRLAEQLCTTLLYLHQHKPPIIFRDLKPSNIMLTSSDQLYLIDFGIARFFKPGQSRDTIPMGSPGYAAPEQYGRAQTTVRSDIFSLGAVLHQLLTGDDPTAKPFVFSPIRNNNNSSVLRQLDDLIADMVNVNQSKRPPSIFEVRARLQAIAIYGRTAPQTVPRYAPPVTVPRSAPAAQHPLPPRVQPPRVQPPRVRWKSPLTVVILSVSAILVACCIVGSIASLAQITPQFSLLDLPEASSTATLLPTPTEPPTPTEIPTPTPVLTYSASIPGPGCGSAGWSNIGAGQDNVQCTAFGLVLTMPATATTTTEAFWSGMGNSSNYAARVTVSNLSSACGGIGFQKGYRGYVGYICSNGAWTTVRYDDTGNPTRLDSGSVEPQSSYLVEIVVSSDTDVEFHVSDVAVSTDVLPSGYMTEAITLALDHVSAGQVGHGMFNDFVYGRT
jgi:serine/threonine protein kinase